jgi:xylitol oxidase
MTAAEQAVIAVTALNRVSIGQSVDFTLRINKAKMIENWAHNIKFTAAKLHQPKTVEQVQAIVKGSSKVKAVGTRHSFNEIADSTGGDLISLKYLDRIVAINPDPQSPTVTVEAGITCGHLSQLLHQRGFALHNLASLPHISIAGACATATHGSGDRNGNLATAVAAMKLVTANGELVEFSRADDHFQGVVVGLGGLGVVTELTLDLLPTFSMRQDVYENLPLAQLENNFDEIVSSAYSVSLFTDWKEPNFNQVWLKSREDAPFQLRPELFGAALAKRQLHPIRELSSENCTEQLGMLGPWHERLPHFRQDFTPSSGQELQSEYLVPRDHAFQALWAVDGLREDVAPLLQISEVRTIAADELWMSPCYQQACIGIHFTWKKEWEEVRRLLPKLEERLEPFQARPHWGKLFAMAPAQLQSPVLFPKLSDFQSLLRLYDPEGKFRNAFLDKYI